MSPRHALPCVVLLAALAGCAYTGEPGGPIERSLTWFSYVGGDDIRSRCRPGGASEFRFVYNGSYERQIRAYDLVATRAGAELLSRARGRAGQIGKLSVNDLQGPWDMARDTQELGDNEAGRIVLAYRGDIERAPSSAGAHLDSKDFFWTVAGCSHGRFSIHAFAWPDTDLDRLQFARLLAQYDRTGVPWEQPRRIEGGDDGARFWLDINARNDGLKQGPF
ncbi:MAG: hypothetical protein FJX53_12930 [Alphaproteobacteria bacterium]|nr:hypothetical protein [Alphaproteobacteria bacterium]